MKLSKCLFTQKRIPFLAHFIEEDRIRMDPPKLKDLDPVVHRDREPDESLSR